MDEKNFEMIFSQLILSLSTAAMHQIGKVQNPLTGRVDKNMEAASHTIDILLMLKKKTKNNLTESENKLLDNIIADIQLNYEEEAKKMENRG